jgi:glyoxylase-like metal-dependent hydrolase (beta-lactamase superfamily II)
MSKKTKISLYVSIVVVVLVVIGGTVFSKRTVNPRRVAYKMPESQIKNIGWDSILSSTADAKIDSFKILHTGSVKVPRSGMLNEEKLKANHGVDDFLWVDVFAFLFHHKAKGWFMIDTGLDRSFQGDGNITGLAASNYIHDSKQEEGQNIGAQLKREQKQIEGIFMTHLHGDHTAGLPEIDPSITKYVGKGDAFLSIPFIYESNHLSNDDILTELNWKNGLNISPFESVIDIFGDGSFFGIHTPGHSKGHLSYLLVTNEGPILLTGDASHTKYGFTHNIEPGWTDNKEVAENSLQQLTKFMELYPQTEIIYGHEQ